VTAGHRTPTTPTTPAGPINPATPPLAAPGAPDAAAARRPTDPPWPRGVVLELAGVTKLYPGEPPVAALRGVDLTVYEGEMLAIAGPSGSGKSTLLHVIGTLDRPTSGTVRVTGLDAAALSDGRLAALRSRRIGFVFQQFFLSEHQSLLDNVGDGLLYAGIAARERRRLALEALDAVGLAERAAHRPTALSGGQRQRVAIARALVGRPAIVLADEPTGNLDSRTGAGIIELLLALHRQGSTIVVITHDHELAERMPRRIDVLDGLIVSDRVTRRPATRPTAASGTGSPRP
jgi:putative ABC transport system ATP-binding protein